MSKPLKPRRGTTAQHASFVGEAHEVTYDTDKQTLVCHDGLTAGGFPLARADEVAAKDADQDAAIAGVQRLAEAIRTGDLVQLDAALREYVANTFFPFTGGRIDGEVLIGNHGKISWDPSIPMFFLCYENNGQKGSGIYFRPRNASPIPGAVVVDTEAPDGGKGESFIFHPDGRLTSEGGNNFLSVIASGGSNANWYRKWSNGLIEQCGYITCNPGLQPTTDVTFAYPFSKSYPSVVVTPNGGGTRTFTLKTVSKTGFSVVGWNASSSAAAPDYMFYYAAGY